MAHASSSLRGAHTKTNRKSSSSSSTSDRAPLSSRLTAVSHLGHLAAFSPGVSIAGDLTTTPPRSPQPIASSSRKITRQDPANGASIRPPPSPLRGEHVTYHTNNLGLFEGQSADPLFGQAPPALSNLFQPTSDAPQRPRLQGYQYTGGWTLNDNGQHVYIPMGNIREIPDEEEDDFLELDGMLGVDDLMSPQMLPPEATPPPRPQAGIYVLPPSVILSPSGWPSETPARSTSVREQPQILLPSDASNSFQRSSPPSSPVLPSTTLSSSSSSSDDDLSSGPPLISPFHMSGQDAYGFAEFLEEEPIVTQNFQSIKRLCDNLEFLAPSRDDKGICKLLINALQRVKDSLTRGLLIPNDLWKFLSEPKRVTFRNRLLSLRRTLTRLERVSTHLTFLRSERLALIVSKLGDHHKKLSDIASKLDATFDLLDLCGLHETASISKRNSPAEQHYLKARESYLRKKPSRTANVS
ncbi:hypothetical protein PQX77_001676 [Marasmius sp. AFHP31]|nr:hypothetical protein PQX77_001676 [Marasmius sp. AFHP31]